MSAGIAGEADAHRLVAAMGLCLEGAEETVPECEHFTVVVVVLFKAVGVVDAVGFWRDEEGAQDVVDRTGKNDIGMTEERMDQVGELIEHYGTGGNAEDPNGGDVCGEGKDRVERVKADAGGEIEIRVGMVDAMDAPKERRSVRAKVLRKADKIDNEDTDEALEKVGEAGVGEDAPGGFDTEGDFNGAAGNEPESEHAG